MKSKLLLAALLSCFTISFLFHKKEHHSPGAKKLFTDALMSDNDADARYRWELMRLADRQNGFQRDACTD